jgi:tRNA U38,U39,U40 pseudouridine synthase TruA
VLRVWKVEVEYEGTRYGGWQRQPHARTVQGELERAAGAFFGAEAEVFARGGLILFRVGASHFLWKMVRRLVGALVEVGRGNLSTGGVRALLERDSNEPAAWTAPPSGLFLERVLYEGDAPPAATNALRFNFSD